ncbi:hypothetical protein pdam_00008552, partial [Pocillopora damicornis]
MTTVKTFSLTSQNLQKFERELKNGKRKRKSLQRNVNPERTEADGRSSGIQSCGSQSSAFKESLSDHFKDMDTEKVTKPRNNSYSLDRPEREAFRRNPEGQSRNESSAATPHVSKINYEEGSVLINYSSDTRSTPESIITIKTKKTVRKGSAHSNVSSAPSYVLNSNQYRMKKMAAKKEKERGQNHEDYENESEHDKYSTVKTTTTGKRAKNFRPETYFRPKTPHLPLIGKSTSSNSVPDMRRYGKRHVTLTLDPDLSRARSVSRSQMASRMSTRSIMKNPKMARGKSVPDLNKEVIMSFFDMERGKNKSAARPVNNKKGGRKETFKKSGTSIIDDIDVTTRRKRLRKRKELPQKTRIKSSLSSASSDFRNARKRKNSLTNIGSSLSSALSMSSMKSSRARQNSRPSTDTISKASSSIKQNRLQPLRKYASYQSGSDQMSTRASIPACDTPISLILKRTPSLRSVMTEYSSYLSLAASSFKSVRSSSRSSLSSTDEIKVEDVESYNDGESTAIGPEATSPEKEEKDDLNNEKQKQIEPERKPSSKASDQQSKRSSSVKKEALTFSNSERLHLPAVRTQSVSSERTVSATPVKEREKAKKKEPVKLPQIVRVNHSLPSFTEATRDTGITRLVKLAKPKESKAVWMTSFWPIVWGNQDMMWPISRGALTANASGRLMALATPKKDFQLDHPSKCSRGQYVYSCGRSSVIWDMQPSALKANISTRVSQLAEPKKSPPQHEEQREAYIFSCGRSSPIWQVSQTAKTAEERELTLRLAHAKRCHPDYRPGREVPWSVSEPAKRAVTSARTEQLARPKTRQDGLIREPTWRVSSASMRTVASARVQELSKAKQTVEGYLPCRETEWHITRNTLRAIASDRIQNLSKPIIRETMDHLQFNPDAFTVRETAKKATASSRVVELAQPIARGHK